MLNVLKHLKTARCWQSLTYDPYQHIQLQSLQRSC